MRTGGGDLRQSLGSRNLGGGEGRGRGLVKQSQCSDGPGHKKPTVVESNKTRGGGCEANLQLSDQSSVYVYSVLYIQCMQLWKMGIHNACKFP